MTELEHYLRSLGSSVAWPPTPDVASRLELRARPRRRALVAVVALAVVALAAAFAVPESRSAILRFFHLRGVTVERVDTLPPAQEVPLAAGLGRVVDDEEARQVLGGPFVPLEHGTLYDQNGFVSTLLEGPLLLSEFGSSGMLKKFATSKVEWVEVEPGIQGLWISGPPHVVFFFPEASPRLAGNVLVWATDRRTFRLEGRGLERDDALRLAREIMGTASD
jgi:hypothetical protein